MKKALLLLPALLILTACGAGSGSSQPAKPAEPNTISTSFWGYDDNLYAETVKLEDGRTITCIVLADQLENKTIGGLSCDWDNANGIIPEEER